MTRRGQGRGEGTAQNKRDIAPLEADEPQPWLIFHSTASVPRCFPISQFGSIKNRTNVPIFVGFILRMSGTENTHQRSEIHPLWEGRVNRTQPLCSSCWVGGKQINSPALIILISNGCFWLAVCLPDCLKKFLVCSSTSCGCFTRTAHANPNKECRVGQGKNALRFLLWSLRISACLTNYPAIEIHFTPIQLFILKILEHRMLFLWRNIPPSAVPADSSTCVLS